VYQNNPNVFWTNVINLIPPKTMKDFAEEVAKKYSLSPQTIRNYCAESRPPTFAQLIAIASSLRVPIESLITKTIERAEDLEDFDYFQTQLELTKEFGKKNGFDIDYQIYKGNVTSFKLTCFTNYHLGDMYPETSSVSASDIKDVYNVVNGNIYPSNCTPAEEEMLYSKRSIYECVNTFCVEGLGKTEYKSILNMFAAYRKGRHSLGVIGKLSPYDFYMLNYELGRLAHNVKI